MTDNPFMSSSYRKSSGGSRHWLDEDPEAWATYEDVVGDIESKNTYGVIGGYNDAYDGRWQLGEDARIDAARILGEPVPSREDFRADPEMEKRFFRAYTEANDKYLRGTPGYDELSPRDKLEVLGYAHNQGHAGAKDWLATGNVGSDGFGTRGTKYSDALAARFAPRQGPMPPGEQQVAAAGPMRLGPSDNPPPTSNPFLEASYAAGSPVAPGGPRAAGSDKRAAAAPAEATAPAIASPAPPGPQQPGPSVGEYAEDAARSAGTGVRDIVSGVAGLATGLLPFSGTSVARDWLRSDPETRPTVPLPMQRGAAMAEEEMTNVLGDKYEPKYAPGHATRLAVNLAPNLLLPGSAAANVGAPLVGGMVGRQLGGDKGEAYGTIAGALSPAAAARIASPVVRSPAANKLIAAGMSPQNMTAGGLSGGRALRIAESELGGRAAERMADVTRQDFRNAALRRSGATPPGTNADAADVKAAISQAWDDSDAAINAVVDQGTISPQGVRALRDAVRQNIDEFEGSLTQGRATPNMHNVARLLDEAVSAGVPINGRVYRRLRDLVERNRRGAADPAQRSTWQNIKRGMDDTFDASLPPGSPVAGEFRRLKDQQRHLLATEDAFVKGGNESGTFTPRQLRTSGQKFSGRSGAAKREAPFDEYGRSGDEIMSALPNSETARRAWYRSQAARIGLGAAGAVAGYGEDEDWISGLAIGAAPWLAGRALMSRPTQAYLKNQRFSTAPARRVSNSLARSVIPTANLLREDDPR